MAEVLNWPELERQPWQIIDPGTQPVASIQGGKERKYTTDVSVFLTFTVQRQ